MDKSKFVTSYLQQNVQDLIIFMITSTIAFT